MTGGLLGLQKRKCDVSMQCMWSKVNCKLYQQSHVVDVFNMTHYFTWWNDGISACICVMTLWIKVMLFGCGYKSKEEVYVTLSVYIVVCWYRDAAQWICFSQLPTGGTERDGLHPWLLDTHQGGQLNTFYNTLCSYSYFSILDGNFDVCTYRYCKRTSQRFLPTLTMGNWLNSCPELSPNWRYVCSQCKAGTHFSAGLYSTYMQHFS